MNSFGFVSRGDRLAALIVVLLLSAACSGDPQAAKLKHVTTGDALLQAGKIPEAVIEYRNAVDKDPRAGDARVKLAEAYLRAGNVAGGLQEYVRAADLLPDPKVQIKAGTLLLLARRFDDARERAKKALTVEATNLEAQVLLANSLAGLKDLNGAVAQLEDAIRLNPGHSPTYSNLGELQLSLGRRVEAEAAFKRAVELAPASALARVSLANFYWLTGQPAGAETEIAEALKWEPDNVLVHRTAATFYLATNRRDQAEPHLRRVVDLTKSPTAALMLADYYVVQNREADARKTLEPMTGIPQSAADADVRLALLDRGSGRPGEAAKRLDRVLAANPTNLQALLLRGSFLLSENKPEEALVQVTAAVKAHPDAVNAQYLLGRVQAARRQSDAAIAAYQEVLRLNPLASDAKLALARLQLAAGRTDASVGMAEEALRTQPGNADAKLVLVQGLIRRGDLQRAEAELETLKRQFPDSGPVHTQAGMLLGRKGQAAAARASFERARALQPSSVEAIGGLVALDLSERRFPEARTRVTTLISSPNPSSASLMLAARTYGAIGDYGASEQTLRRVLSSDPSYLGAYAALGQLYARQGKLDAALAEFDGLAKRDPKPVAALTLAGMILEAQGKRVEAQQRFERAIQLDSEAPVAANNLAWIYAEHGGNLDVALQLAQTAKRRLPKVADVDDTLGYVYLKKGLLKQAIEALQSAVDQEPSNAAMHYHLGLAFARSGNVDGAQQHLKKALSLNPTFDGSADAAAVLRTLPGR